ncbi:hypothetical protein BDP55DRAFT_392281 [Colletotrichum godetiae]|uniref:Uncharacterized protein n=1 Tax=Colletotrichum godetiae TaxID=1209918 RepID=A0AAJ0ABN0_9PEZI|nr:uncharacterized protein BDP55DRAFT_392281 [Colletotrichum godetiae]KAK1658627.1 hypothetical protein BDP55DRAFT_392281 [Colletotrichum godetiae]
MRHGDNVPARAAVQTLPFPKSPVHSYANYPSRVSIISNPLLIVSCCTLFCGKTSAPTCERKRLIKVIVRHRRRTWLELTWAEVAHRKEMSVSARRDSGIVPVAPSGC